MRTAALKFAFFCAACLINAITAAAVHRFIAIDVYLETNEPVAAWQFELQSPNARIVGVENGESAAFGKAPYYDREAVQRGASDRIVVADFSLEDAKRLPSGRFRIATLHLVVDGGSDPALDVELITAVTRGGEAIDASIDLEPRTGDQR